MLIGIVWICRLLFVCLFVNLSVCTVTDFSAGDKASGVKFCTMVHGRPGHEISHFGELCSPRSPQSDESAPVMTICSFHKMAPYQRGGCPDTLDTPCTRPCEHKRPIKHDECLLGAHNARISSLFTPNLSNEPRHINVTQQTATGHSHTQDLLVPLSLTPPGLGHPRVSWYPASTLDAIPDQRNPPV